MLRIVSYEPNVPIQMAFSADPADGLVALVHVRSAEDEKTYRFAGHATVPLPTEGRGRISVVVEWVATGHLNQPYTARLELSQRGRQLAAIGFAGILPAAGSPFRVDQLSIVPDERVRRRSYAPVEPSGAPPSAAAIAEDLAEYTVFYATNRARTDPTDAGKGYSAERSTSVDYGSCRVFIPKSHKIGSLGSPWWKRLLTMTDDRLRLLGISATSADDHWKQIRARLATDGDAVVFVHGYNVSFDEAALRAAQIGFDLQIQGAMAFFSWPSQGTLDGYLADAATIEASEGMIADYLSDFAARSGATTVHVIAHSMGNRGVLRAVNRIAAAAQERSGVRFGQFILAAADVDADTFRQLSNAYTRLARRTTLYVSARDRAVEASRWLHHFPRAGLIPPVLILPEIDTINVTNADLTMLGHGYVAAARDVLTDIHALIRHGHAPQDRFGLREAKTETGERYWLIGA